MIEPVFPPQEMKEVVQSSGENGTVMFTAGSVVSYMSEERASVIASALPRFHRSLVKGP